MITDLFFRLRSLFRRNAVQAELDAELRAYVENDVEKYVAAGGARLAFGGLETNQGAMPRVPWHTPPRHDHPGHSLRSPRSPQESRIHRNFSIDRRNCNILHRGRDSAERRPTGQLSAGAQSDARRSPDCVALRIGRERAAYV
jgi:hypothetical protein